MKSVGFVLSRSSQDLVYLVVKANYKEEVKRGTYCFLLRKEGEKEVKVLLRVYKTIHYNPSLEIGRPGVLVCRDADELEIPEIRMGRYSEFILGYAEPLGYFDESGKWRGMDFTPEAGTPVYLPDPGELSDYFLAEREAFSISVGRASGTSMEAYLVVDRLVTNHAFICGMTRSGKSTFVANFVRQLLTEGEKKGIVPRVILFDRRGEYVVPLQTLGDRVRVKPYTAFLPRIDQLDLDAIIRRLNLDPSRYPDRLFVRKLRERLVELSARRETITFDEICSIAEEIANELQSKFKRTDMAVRADYVREYGSFLEKHFREPEDPINILREAPVLLIDFSIDTLLEDQQQAARYVVERAVSYGIETQGRFPVLLIIEEAQYYVPERGMFKVGDPYGTGVARAIVEGMSQAGGYNVGFILMSQRPAYVSKSAISQCGTVISFRLANENDQDTLSRYTEYGGKALKQILAGLSTHEALMWGVALPTPFPLLVETLTEIYPQKAVMRPSEAWRKLGGG